MAIMTKAELPLLVLFLSTLLLATSVPSASAQVTCEEGCYSISDQSKVGECLQMCSSHGQPCEDRCRREARWPQQQEQCLSMCRQQEDLSCFEQCIRSPDREMSERACGQQDQGQHLPCVEQYIRSRSPSPDREMCQIACGQQEPGQHLPCFEQCIRSPDRELCKRACQRGRQCLHQCEMITRDPRERQECLIMCIQVQKQVEQQCRQHCQSERDPIRQQVCQKGCVGQMMQQEYEQQCRSRCQWERPPTEQCQEECTEKIRQLEQCQEGCKMQGQYYPQQQECQRMCREQFERGQGIRMVA